MTQTEVFSWIVVISLVFPATTHTWLCHTLAHSHWDSCSTRCETKYNSLQHLLINLLVIVLTPFRVSTIWQNTLRLQMMASCIHFTRDLCPANDPSRISRQIWALSRTTQHSSSPLPSTDLPLQLLCPPLTAATRGGVAHTTHRRVSSTHTHTQCIQNRHHGIRWAGERSGWVC